MIRNNYEAMLFMRESVGSRITPDIILELQRILTEGTLDNPDAAGRVQLPDEERVAVLDRRDGTVLHTPPPADELPARLKAFCDFANDSLEAGPFVHPVVRAIILHFWAGQPRDERRPGALSAVHGQRAAERLDAVAQTAQPRAAQQSAPPTPSSATSTTALPLVCATLTRTSEARVLGRVGERLRDQVVRRRLDRRGQALLELGAQVDRGAAPGRRASRAPARALCRTGSPGGCRAPARAAPRAPRKRSLEACSSSSAARGSPSASLRSAIRSSSRQRDQPLLRAVVQVALDPAPRLVAGLHDAGARVGELLARLRVGQGLGDQLGEAGDSGARSPPATAPARRSRRSPRPTGARRGGSASRPPRGSRAAAASSRSRPPRTRSRRRARAGRCGG